jgi:hypothetical protein
MDHCMLGYEICQREFTYDDKLVRSAILTALVTFISGDWVFASSSTILALTTQFIYVNNQHSPQ